MKTDRLTLLISPAEKAALSARAEALGVTVSELMRQAAMRFDPAQDDEIATLHALTTELSDQMGRLRGKLDAAFEEAERTRHHIGVREAAADEARERIGAGSPVDWSGIRDLFGFGERDAASVARSEAVSRKPSPMALTQKRDGRAALALARQRRRDRDRGRLRA